MSWGAEREANLSGWEVPRLGNIVPKVDTLEDPDEGRPIHMGKKKEWNCIIPMPRWENVILKLFQVLKHNSLRKLHVHNIIFI